MNKRGLVWVLLAVAILNLAYALASGARLDEMSADVMRLEDGGDRDILLEGVNDYIKVRDEALDQLKALVAETDEGELRSQWDSIVQDMVDLPELDDLNGNLITDPGLALYNSFVDAERTWWLALSRINTAAHRDSIVQQRLRLVNMTELLEDKWEELLSEDGALDQKERDAIAEISETYSDTAREISDTRERTRGYANTLADIAANDMVGSFIPGVLGDIVSMGAQTVKAYNTYRSAVEGMQAQLKEMSAQELKLLEGFLATRRDTQLFVEQNGFDVMKARYVEAERDLSSFTGVGTSAQRRDAEDFANLVKGSLSRHVSEGENIFNSFVTKHQGKFFGPIAPDTKEALLETQVWLAEGKEAETRGRDLQELLRAWRDDANSLFGVNFSRDGITDEERQFIQDYLRGDLEAVMKAMEEGQTFVQNLTVLFDRRGLEDTLK